MEAEKSQDRSYVAWRFSDAGNLAEFKSKSLKNRENKDIPFSLN